MKRHLIRMRQWIGGKYTEWKTVYFDGDTNELKYRLSPKWQIVVIY